jgi:hypothetical protein
MLLMYNSVRFLSVHKTYGGWGNARSVRSGTEHDKGRGPTGLRPGWLLPPLLASLELFGLLYKVPVAVKHPVSRFVRRLAFWQRGKLYIQALYLSLECFLLFTKALPQVLDFTLELGTEGFEALAVVPSYLVELGDGFLCRCAVALDNLVYCAANLPICLLACRSYPLA